jgi:chromosome partitioning protein
MRWVLAVQRVIIASPKGGGGKSTLTRNLAVAASYAGVHVATADLDPQATLTAWSRRRPPDKAIPHYRVGWGDADALLDDEELHVHELVLIDTPPSIEAQPAAFKKLLTAADLVLVPCRPTFDDAESVTPFLKHLRDTGKRSVVVLTFIKPRVNVNAVKTYLLEVAEICPIEVGDRTDYARAGAKGLALIDIPNSSGGEEMHAIWMFIKKSLNGSRARGTAKA